MINQAKVLLEPRLKRYGIHVAYLINHTANGSLLSAIHS